ncbi:ArnT family glycosyltransferase [Thalassobacterium maritimum]|nr:glycosyltransferase family 39 protein [Coraliomargarita sp. SDUM461003]
MPETVKPPISQSTWRRCSLVLGVLILLLSLCTVGDYGMSWDEDFRFKGGDSKLSYYTELLRQESPQQRRSSYPGLFDLPLAAVHQALPDWGTRSQKGHVWSLCFGLLGLLSVWRLTARIGGERAGFWALLFLATLPRYYGHMFFNPKDIPLAGTYAFGVWALVALFSELPKVSRWSVVWVGLAAGLAMSTRIAGFLILVYLGLFVALYLLILSIKRFRGWSVLSRDLLNWALRGAVAGLLAFALLFVFWPTIHVNPFASVGNSVSQVQSFGWSGMVLMDGLFWEAQDLPIYYLPYWFFRTTPEYLLLLMGGGLLLGLMRIYSCVRQREWPEPASFLPLVVLAFSGLFPIVYIIAKDPVLYDGLRHILFTLPPLLAMAALCFEWCLRWGERQGRRMVPFVLQVGGALAVLIVAIQMWQLHPYQYTYFNPLAGGLAGAYNHDETDYWGLSHKEAGEWLNAYAATLDPDGAEVFKVHQRYSRWMLEEALDSERFEMSQSREGADFFVSVTRFNLHVSYPEAQLLHTVERQGVPLCFIYRFSQGSSE